MSFYRIRLWWLISVIFVVIFSLIASFVELDVINLLGGFSVCSLLSATVCSFVMFSKVNKDGDNK